MKRIRIYENLQKSISQLFNKEILFTTSSSQAQI